MRITPRRPGIDHRRAPRSDPQRFASDRTIAIGTAGLALGLALVVLLAHPVAAEEDESGEKSAIPSWYTQTFARSDTGSNVTYFWSLRSKLRSETVVRGHKLVTIVNGDTYYVYDALAMTGIAIRRAPAALAAESPDLRPFGNETQLLIEQGGEKIREEDVAGQRVAVYQITDENGRRSVWATQDDRQLPIRVEFFNRKSRSTRYKEYVDWVSGLPVPDAFFEPEPGIRFERFELDEYTQNTLAKDSAATFPILHKDLLHGPAPR